MRRPLLLLFLVAAPLCLLATQCGEDVTSPSDADATPDGATTSPGDGAAATTSPSDAASADDRPTTDAGAPPSDRGDGGSDGGAGCPAGYEDLDGDGANGCETKTPLGVAAASLQLWLRADRELSCAAGDVAMWKDQSGHARHAAPVAGHRAPTCVTHPSGPVTPYFGAADVDAATPIDAGRWDEDTLAVDLSFLANTPYTIITVDRRHLPSKIFSYFIGTGVPEYDHYGPLNTDQGLHVGYRAENLFWFDQFNNAVSFGVPTIDGGTEGGYDAPHWSVAMNGAVDGGSLQVADWMTAADGGASRPMPNAADGRIGRGFGNTGLDTRYRGDVSEVIVYTKALSEAELDDVLLWVKRHWGLP